MITTVLLGTPAEALPTLEALAQETRLVGLITRPDRPRGRGRRRSSPTTKVRASALGIPVHQPDSRPELEVSLAAIAPDLAVVVGYGMLVPERALTYPRLGMVNLHFSLLPRWRGAAPVERAILAGDTRIGVSLMQVTPGLDTGPILSTWETPIGAGEDAGSLYRRLARGGADLLVEELGSLAEGRLAATIQDETQATWAPRITTAEARLDFHDSAEQLMRVVRAFAPRPGAHTTWRGERFKVLKVATASGRLDPGDLRQDGSAVKVGTGDGCLTLATVQPASRPTMDAGAWMRGVRGPLGRFE